MNNDDLNNDAVAFDLRPEDNPPLKKRMTNAERANILRNKKPRHVHENEMRRYLSNMNVVRNSEIPWSIISDILKFTPIPEHPTSKMMKSYFRKRQKHEPVLKDTVLHPFLSIDQINNKKTRSNEEYCISNGWSLRVIIGQLSFRLFDITPDPLSEIRVFEDIYEIMAEYEEMVEYLPSRNWFEQEINKMKENLP
jgi:hypothetical protein